MVNCNNKSNVSNLVVSQALRHLKRSLGKNIKKSLESNNKHQAVFVRHFRPNKLFLLDLVAYYFVVFFCFYN